MTHPEAITLEGCLERITYANPANHYTVARFAANGIQQPITITGYLGEVHPGEALRISGCWETHPKYGDQFRVENHEIAPPSSADDIRRLLASGAITGVGPQLAARLVERFGDDTLGVIGSEPERLVQVEGIGPSRAAHIHAAWREQADWRQLLQALAQMGIRSTLAAPLFAHFGNEAVGIISEDPYRLMAELPELGFELADQLAQRSARPIDPFVRGCAWLRHLLHRLAADGHTCMREEDLLEGSDERHGIAFELAHDCLAELERSGELCIENTVDGRLVSPARLCHAEKGVARRLTAMQALPLESLPLDRAKLAQVVQRSLSLELSENQLDTLHHLLAHRVAVISGGPGTGKTTLIRSICTIFERETRSVVLGAPTGRAARRLSQVSGRDAHTLHRLLEYQPAQGSFFRNRDRPLAAKVVIVDEVSMVDIELMHALLQAVHLQARLILVGDADQLPSVGSGNVLADMIRSERIPVYYLTDIFRQDKESLIAVNAHRVRRGEAPVDASPDVSGEPPAFVFLERDHPQQVLEATVHWCSRQIPQRYGLHPITGIQVLTPMHKGTVGTLHLNQVLQRALNTAAEGIGAGGYRFKRGDKVIHLVNNYQKEVFNGDIGVICGVDAPAKTILVDFDGRQVRYAAAELHELAAAYAITVHKSQGSEYPAVIIPLVTQHYMLLQRNVLYTALTRARQLAVLIGSRKALGICLRRDQPGRRLTRLAERLVEGAVD